MPTNAGRVYSTISPDTTTKTKMFKKIAHNSTIPSLAGNSELRPLQDLITAEKAVLISCVPSIIDGVCTNVPVNVITIMIRLQKLGVDFARAADALRAWGVTEGDDLAVRPPILIIITIL